MCIHRDGLLAGIALARDVLGAPRVESPRDDLGISFPEDPASNLTAQECPVSADIILARVVDGQLVDLTDADVRMRSQGVTRAVHAAAPDPACTIRLFSAVSDRLFRRGRVSWAWRSETG